MLSSPESCKNQSLLTWNIEQCSMELDQKIRYGMMGLTAASVVLATLGVRMGGLEIAGIEVG